MSVLFISPVTLKVLYLNATTLKETKNAAVYRKHLTDLLKVQMLLWGKGHLTILAKQTMLKILL